MTSWIASILLLLAAMHEFAWQWFPAEMQGDIEVVTRWPLICALCFCVGVLSRDRNIQGACAAIATMSVTTAACSLWWLLDPWPTVPGGEQCSTKWGPLSLLLSGLVACVVIAYWRWADHGPKPR